MKDGRKKMVSLNQILEIKERYADGGNISSIAREMGLDWKTVDKYVKKDDFNETVEDHVKKIRPSKLDPYKGEMDKLLEDNTQHLTATEIYDILVKERGYTELSSSYQIIRIYVNEARKKLMRSSD